MEDSRIQQLRAALRRQPPRRAPRPPGAREAAVALIVRPAASLELLMIRRVERSSDPWSGHMAFPGGRRDPGDADLIATAVRETAEEVGLTLDPAAHLLGALDEVTPASARLPPIVIAPFAALAPEGAEPRPDAREVAAALWIPLPALREEGALGEVLIDLEGGPRAFPAYLYQEYEIWGLTHRILSRFLELVPGE